MEAVGRNLRSKPPNPDLAIHYVRHKEAGASAETKECDPRSPCCDAWFAKTAGYMSIARPEAKTIIAKQMNALR